MGGRGVWRVIGEVGQLEVDYTFYKDTDSSVVSSLSYRNKYNSQHRPRLSLGAAWHYVCPC